MEIVDNKDNFYTKNLYIERFELDKKGDLSVMESFINRNLRLEPSRLHD